MAKSKVVGYLPNDTPPMGQLILLGFQHVLTMFPATVLGNCSTNDGQCAEIWCASS